MPQIRQYPEAFSITPTDAFIIDRQAIGTMYVEAQFALATSLIYAANAFYQGSSPPTTSLLLGGWSLPVPATFPDTYANSLVYGWGAHAEVLPTSNFAVSILLNDVLAATLTFLPAGGFNYVSATGLVWQANVRDRITATAPVATDATINNFFFTMAGTIG